MVAKHEARAYDNGAKIYIAKYKNLNNVLHWHYDCELIFAASGRLDVYANGANYVLYGGQAMFIGNMEEHCIKTHTESEVYILIFNYDILRGLIKNQRLKTPVLCAENGYDLMPLYENVKSELTNKKAYYERTIECLIVNAVINIFQNEKVIKTEYKKKDKIIFMQLLNDIEAKYCYYTADDAAKFLHFNKDYFSKYFRKMTGLVFTGYLNAVRVSKTIQMLKSNNGKTVSEIASECGFNTIRNFNRVFKELTGLSPTEIPADYIFEDAVFFSSSGAAGFNPTLRETVLLESLGGKNIV